jgi:hypothetical protein
MNKPMFCAMKKVLSLFKQIIVSFDCLMVNAICNKYFFKTLNHQINKIMNPSKLAATIALGVFVALASCKKNEDPKVSPTPIPNPIPGSYSSLSKAFEEVAPKSKTVSINASVGGTFYGNSGTRYIFMPNSFINSSGTVVSGNVDIEVLECTNEADMIFAKILPMSNGEMLYSGGEIRVRASQAGSSLNIRPGYRYTVKMPTNNGASTAGMDVFRGVESTVNRGSSVDWTILKDSTTGGIIYDGDTIIMTPDSVGFTNCDKYAAYSKVTVDVKLDGTGATIDSNNVYAYFLPEGFLSAVSLYGTSFVSNTMKSCSVPMLKSHLVACTVVGGNFYAGYLSGVTPSSGTTYTISLSKTTPTAFKTAISTLK